MHTRCLNNDSPVPSCSLPGSLTHCHQQVLQGPTCLPFLLLPDPGISRLTLCSGCVGWWSWQDREEALFQCTTEWQGSTHPAPASRSGFFALPEAPGQSPCMVMWSPGAGAGQKSHSCPVFASPSCSPQFQLCPGSHLAVNVCFSSFLRPVLNHGCP
jgi:hypothetical protein